MKDQKQGHQINRRVFLGTTVAATGAVTAGYFLLRDQDTSVQARPKSQWSIENVAIGGGGAVPGILLHPQVPDLAYIRTDVGAAYRWDAAQARWIPLFDWIPLEKSNLYGVESLAIDPGDASGNTLYAALGKYDVEWALPPRGTIMKSTDRGATWVDTDINAKVGPSSNWQQRYGERLSVDPNHGQIVYYASAGYGLWRSIDAGTSWQQQANAPLGDLSGKGQWGGPQGLTWITFDKNTGSTGNPTATLYLGAWNEGVYRSSDAGASWQLLSGSPSHPCRATIDAQGKLYVAHATGLATFANDSWQDITPPSEVGNEFLAVAVNPFDTQHLITARHFWGFHNPIYLSSDGGQNWTSLQFEQQGDVPWWPEDFFAASVFSLGFDPHHRNRVYFTDWFGTWHTDDITATPSLWVTQERGHEEIVSFTLMSCPVGASLFSGVADVGGFRHTVLSEYPQPSQRYTPTFQDTTGIDFSEGDPNFIVRCGGHRDSGHPGGGAYSTDNGVNWTLFASHPQPSSKNGRVAVSANSHGFVWIPMGDIPYVSTDNGTTWTASTGAPTDTVLGTQVWSWHQPLASDRVDGKTFYLYDRHTGKFFRSVDGGQSWTATAASLPISDWHKVEAVPGNAREVWVSLDTQGLWRSTDGGDSFTRIPSVQKAYLHAFGKPERSNKNPTLFVYGIVNNQAGLYISENRGSTWVKMNPPEQALGNDPNALAGDRQTFGRVYIGSNGRGIFSVSLSGRR